MPDVYCFTINNPTKKKYDSDQLTEFAEKLYKGTKEPKFTKEDKSKFPIQAYLDIPNNAVCVKVSSSSKKTKERIEQIHESMKAPIKFKDDITLSKPTLFEVKAKEWWVADKKPLAQGQRWSTLSHRGPYFTYLLEPYQPVGGSLKYKGKSYPLSPEEEKVASFYARRLISEEKGTVSPLHTQDEIFNDNYWIDFKTYLTKEHKQVFKNLSEIDWSDLKKKLEKKELSEEEKKKKTRKTEEKKAEYAYAKIDGVTEKVGNFIVEPAAIFYGRGSNPKRGRVKREVRPEDVTINIGSKDKVPTPPPGHKWGEVIHDTSAAWLAKWKDTLTGNIKYVWFSAEGQFKGQSDMLKYEKARKLHTQIDTIRKQYMADAKSKDLKKQQLGTVLYIIDRYGVRVGNDDQDLLKEKIEKGSGDENVVGASTLRVGHINMKDDDVVNFNFLGKDSIQFDKDLAVPPEIYKNFGQFIKNKKPDAKVFNLITSTDINNYLKDFDKDFSAKVFRTRLASEIMHAALKDVQVPKGTTKANVKILFNKANAKVADVLNHTRNATAKSSEAIKKAETDLKKLKKDLAQAKKEGKSTTSLEKRIKAKKASTGSKKELQSVAVTTSLNNYIDPRLVVSWANKEEADISAIYTATLMKKFKWAIDSTPKNWDWLKTPLVDMSGASDEPSDKKSTKSVKSKKATVSKASKPKKKVVVEPEEPEDENDEPVVVKKSKPNKPKKKVVVKEPESEDENSNDNGDEDTDSDKDQEKPTIQKLPGEMTDYDMAQRSMKSLEDLKKRTADQKKDYETILAFCMDPENPVKILNMEKVGQHAMKHIYLIAKRGVDSEKTKALSAKKIIGLYENYLLPKIYKQA